MSIFGSIISKIFGAQAVTPATGSASDAPSGGTASSASAGGSAGGASASGQPVDVEKILTDLAAKSDQPSNWRQSIVDLMKLLGLDSSLTARKELAKEMFYTGDTDHSATMNVWLHKQVMQKLAENGGKVPDSLKG